MISISETDKDVINRLLTCGVSRILARHAIVVLHHYRNTSKEDIPGDVLFCGCLLYAQKQCNHPSDSSFLCSYSKQVRETDVIGFELALVQVVRQNVLLVEACLRPTLHELLLSKSICGPDRKRLIQISLHFINELYKTRWCLLPQVAARGALRLACEKCNIALLQLPASFTDRSVDDVVTYLRSCFECHG
ncbi:hypothetical protein TRVL_02249 [Trypanosoma vivax]|nr:hypothetical protein TRVL_02249 [Trypanosoma vivax]